MEQNNQEQQPINLINVLIRFKNAFFQLWPLVVVLALLGGILFFFQAKASFTPMYESRAIFTVDSGYDINDIFSTGAYYDQYAAEQLAAAFPHILSTDMMNDLVVQQLDKGYITGYATAEAIVDSNMLVLTVRDRNPKDAYDYACALIDYYPQLAGVMVDKPQMHIMSNPSLPTEPYNSFSGLGSTVQGVLIGTMLGMIIVFLCGLLTRTIQTADELKSTVNLPILVALPKVTQKKRRSGVNTLITADSDPNMSESIRGLRVKVKKLLSEQSKKTILVTSTLAGEGKTTVSINLAQTLMHDGHKVVLLDADLRSQSIARTLGEKATGNGLMDCLKDSEVSILDCVRTTKNGLSFISGRSTEKRHYSIDTAAVQQILKILSQHYDYIVIDTPPSEVVSDATALCRCADCVLYVIKQDYAQKGQVLNAVTSLHHKDVKIAGCVFNGVPQFHRQYGYGYRSTYGYGYDYGYRKYSYGSKYNYGYGKYGKYAQKNSGKTE